MLSQGYHPFITSHFYRTLNLSSLHIREPLQDCIGSSGKPSLTWEVVCMIYHLATLWSVN